MMHAGGNPFALTLPEARERTCNTRRHSGDPEARVVMQVCGFHGEEDQGES